MELIKCQRPVGFIFLTKKTSGTSLKTNAVFIGRNPPAKFMKMEESFVDMFNLKMETEYLLIGEKIKENGKNNE